MQVVARWYGPVDARAVAAAATLVLLASACSEAPEASPAAPGPPAPAAVSEADLLDVSAPTLDGGELDLADLTGDPVVLWFWAPWCTICRAEAPDVAAVAADLTGEVTFIGVPGLGAVEDMRDFVEDTGTSDLVHVLDGDGSLWQRFGVVSQPTFVFVRPDGSAERFAGALPAEQLRAAASALAAG